MDQRNSRRTRSLLNGRIIFNNRSSVIDCTIRDVSETGARIVFAHPVQIPPGFELDIPKRGPAVRARVIWSNGNEHGVSFVDRLGPSPVSSPSDKSRDLTRPSSGPHEQAVPSPTMPEVQQILDDTRARIAHLVGVPIDAVKLKVEIDDNA